MKTKKERYPNPMDPMAILEKAHRQLKLSERKRVMVEYMQLKMKEEDWHGVADASMDLRELEVEIKLGR